MVRGTIKKKIKKIVYAVSLFFLSLLVLCSSIVGGWSAPIGAIAAGGEQREAFEKTDVLADLTTMTIDGKAFSLNDYGFDTKKETNVLTMAEYCYSFDHERQDNYGLYIYVHNPKALDIVDDVRNQVSLRVNGTGNYQKYDLELLSVCELADFERLFYKFAVRFTESERAYVLGTVASTKRIYEISEIELRAKESSGVQAYPVSSIYRYEGYAAGYGANASADSTLRMEREDTETITLDVHSTYYRPEGNNGKDNYTQDTLHSVYFAVPNAYIEKYGEMTAVHATWLEAVLKPALVIDSELWYTVLDENFAGRYVGMYDDDVNIAFMGAAYENNLAGTLMMAELGYNVNTDIAVCPDIFGKSGTVLNEVVPALYLFFYGDDLVTSEQIMAKMASSYARFGGNPIYGGENTYTDIIFESVADEYRDVNIGIDDEYELSNVVISQTWWEDLMNLPGTQVEFTTTFDGIKAIEAVDVENLSRDSAIDSQRYYFAENDCDEFYEYVDEYSAENTIYFFRYRTSDYQAYDMTMYQEDTFLGMAEYDLVDGVGGYFFRSAVDLNFDIIDVRFTSGEIETVIGCVMTPIDIVHDATPPTAGSIIDDDDDNEGLPWWVWLIIIVVAVILLVFVIKLIVRFISWLWRKITGRDYDDKRYRKKDTKETWVIKKK